MIRIAPLFVAALVLVAATPAPSPSPVALPLPVPSATGPVASPLPPGVPAGNHAPSPSPAASASAGASPADTAEPTDDTDASPSPDGQSSGMQVGVWTITAQSVDMNLKTGDFKTPGKVVMVRVGGDVTADKADGNYKDQLVNLHGNVVIHDTSGQYSAHQRGQQSSPSTLTCDDAIVDGKGKIYTATGNVHYVSADTNVTSDSGTLSELTHDLFLTGNVHMAQGPRSVVADKVHFNTLTGIAMASSDTKKGVVMLVPGQFSRGLATPKPLHVPKNPVSKPVPSSAP